MKSSTKPLVTSGLTAVLLSTTTLHVHAHHHQVVRETCTAYRRTETYKPGHYNEYGTWVTGRVVRGQVEIPCSTYETPAPVVAHHPHYNPAPAPQGQQVLVNAPTTAASAPHQLCGGKVVRMGLGGILGGLAGRYAVGGSKSNKTILGTTIGAATGALLGRATC